MSTSESLLCMRNVGRVFDTPAGPVPVLKHVNLALNAGDFLMVTGPSGSGKTTLLNLAALMDRPTSGQILFRGVDVTPLAEDERAEIRKTRIGVVFQRFHLLPERSALENVCFRFRYFSKPPDDAEKRAWLALKAVGLTGVAHRQARLLSAGEMQRVAIARAIAWPPDLLVADEPTGNLDHSATEAVMDCFTRLHRERHITVLMVTHNVALRKFATRHVVCEDGRLAEKNLEAD